MHRPRLRIFSPYFFLLLIGSMAGAMSVGCTPEPDNSTGSKASAADVEQTPVNNQAALALGSQDSNSQDSNSQGSNSQGVNSTRATRLSMARLDVIDAELGDYEQLIRNQSFAVNLPQLGILDFVPSMVQGSSGSSQLALRWRDLSGSYIPLFLSEQGYFDGLSAVAFEDIEGDGLGPDIVAIAQYRASASAQPGWRSTVLFNDGTDQFSINPNIETLLAQRGVATVEDVRATLRELPRKAFQSQAFSSQAGADALSLAEFTAGTYARIKVNEQFCADFVCASAPRQYSLKDARLQSEVVGDRLKISLLPSAPISQAAAIAYGQILSSQANIIFARPLIKKEGDALISATYLPSQPKNGLVLKAGHFVKFEFTDEETVSAILFSSVAQ
ncbi:MAG: hypothetical protein AAF703_14380 [Cyanobacteria bacterium P01_D01_bin.105]